MYLWSIFALLLVKLSHEHDEIIITDVIENVNLETQLVYVSSNIKIKNVASSPLNSFIYTLPSHVQHYHIEFKHESHILKYKKNDSFQNHDCHCFKVSLTKSLPPNREGFIRVGIVYMNLAVPLQKTIRITEDQMVSYRDNVLFYSPYPTENLEKNFYRKGNFSGLTVSHQPNRQQLDKISYHHKDVPPFSFEEISLIYENNQQFLVVTNLERTIDVSHYGKICIEEKINIKNEGSKHVGPYEQEKGKLENAASVWWYTHLPTSAEEIQYFDTIGNNSKSEVLRFRTYTTLKFKPRYPLLGGWKTFYIIKYHVPLHEYLFHDGRGKYTLKVRAVDHVLNNVMIRSMKVKIMLPEGADILEVYEPEGFQREEMEKSFTGLTTFGRPTVVLNGTHIVEKHIDDVVIRYYFATQFLYRVPLVLVAYIKAVFVLVIIFIRVGQIKL